MGKSWAKLFIWIIFKIKNPQHCGFFCFKLKKYSIHTYRKKQSHQTKVRIEFLYYLQ